MALFWLSTWRYPLNPWGRRGRPRSRSTRLALESLEERALLSTFLVTSLKDSGAGSLRAAIAAVNKDTNSAVDLIDFNLSGTGPYTIKLLSELPVVTHAFFMDGSSQRGYSGTPLIQLDASGIPGGGDGLTIDARGHAGKFSAEVLGLALARVNDGISVLDTGSATPVNVQLQNNRISAASGDGIQVWAGTSSSQIRIIGNQVFASGGGDGIIVHTAGTATADTINGNLVRVHAGADGIRVDGNGTTNTVSVNRNNVVADGSGDALAITVDPTSSTFAAITNNRLSTNSLGDGLWLSGSPTFQAIVQGNNFQGDFVGVEVHGDGTSAGIIDLGGGTLGSTGGNDFTKFGLASDNSYAIGLFDVTADYHLSAKLNKFSVDPASATADGTHDLPANGSGVIDL